MILELTLLDRLPSLLEDQIDIAVVIGRLPNSALIRRGLGEVGMIVCGAPEYLDSRGIPSRPQDLSAHHCLVFSTMPSPPLNNAEPASLEFSYLRQKNGGRRASATALELARRCRFGGSRRRRSGW